MQTKTQNKRKLGVNTQSEGAAHRIAIAQHSRLIRDDVTAFFYFLSTFFIACSLFNCSCKLFGCPPAQRSSLPVSLSSLMVYAGPWLPVRTLLASTVYALSQNSICPHIEHIDLCIAIYHSAILENSLVKPWKSQNFTPRGARILNGRDCGVRKPNSELGKMDSELREVHYILTICCVPVAL